MATTCRRLSVIVPVLNLGYVHGTAGRVHRRSETTPPQRELLMALARSLVWSAAGR